MSLFSNSIHKAIKNSDLDTIKKILDSYEDEKKLHDDINEATIKLGTPLQMAVKKNDVALTVFLLKRGAQKTINTIDAVSQQPPLFFAVRLRNILLASLLLAYGAQETINNVGFMEQTMINEAAEKDDLAMIKLLLKYGASKSINKANIRNETPLYWAIKNGSKAMVKLLLEHGAQITQEIKNLTIHDLVIKQLIYLGL